METQQYISGDTIKVKRDSYTAFNGQRGKFLRYTRIDEQGRQLAEIDFGIVCELPVETFEKI